ncbi:glycosyltransferase family 4 protein [Neobacillus mesonae]|uniref:glycosyltransferase family 4 protein n=1 Tax=Neobacillus mesonae TaxID=1193713 RepID=UPI002E1E37F6|nr:glycosyltransferase family 4 protein [Neobacillus mesonae]
MSSVNKGDLDILLMVDNNLDVVGGGKESTKIIVEGVKDSYSVALIQPGKIEKNNIFCETYELSKYKRMKTVFKNPVAFIKYFYDVYRIIKLNRPKVIHTQEQVSFFMVALLKKLKLVNYSFTLIHTDRGLYTKYGKFIKMIFLFFIKELDIFITTTKFNMKYWKQAIEKRYSNKEYKVIENTAGRIYEDLDESRVKSNSRPLVIGFAGRYCDWKNWPLAEEICNKLKSETDIDFQIYMAVGCLDDKSEKETKQMFSRLKENLHDRFKGEINVKFEEMEQFYYDIDIFILTSNYNTESFGRTIVEAMSRKTVALTTNAGGSVEVVGNQDNVCRVANDFVNRILHFYNNEELFENEKRSNLKRVKENYSLNNNLVKHVNMYTNILN